MTGAVRAALLGLALLLAACAPETTRAQSAAGPGVPTDYLIQMVCVDAADRAIFADPVDCQTSRRKLRPGEPLPYHKVDVGGYQISDSFPLASADPQTLGVQTYFFTDAWDLDPAFPRQVRLDPARGGYNILGADGDFAFFRGTSDPGAYWQPWWTPDCRAEGWLLYPNTTRAFRRGEANSPATFAPGCEGAIRTNASTVEWRFLPAHPFVGERGRTRRLDTIEVRHFAAGYGAMETNHFTREYGVTRWEAWRVGRGLTPDYLPARCPGVSYQQRFHGKTFSMVDCRSWTTLVRPEGGSWDPDGASAVNPTILTFPVDPLYTGGNLLMNSHLGGPHTPNGSFTCDPRGWDSEGEGARLAFGEVTGPPWNANGSCMRTIQAAALPSRDLGQTIDAPAPGDYRFGASLFAPGLAPGRSTRAEIVVVQTDASGAAVATDRLPVSIVDRFRTFEGRAAVRPDAAEIRVSIRPLEPGVALAVTGAYLTAD